MGTRFVFSVCKVAILSDVTAKFGDGIAVFGSVVTIRGDALDMFGSGESKHGNGSAAWWALMESHIGVFSSKS